MITPTHADALAARLLADLRTNLGGLHIEHARRVATAVTAHGDRAVVAGLLHDTVENGRISWSEFALAVDDEGVVRIIDALTRRDGETYAEYLHRCAQNGTATLVKRADLLDKLGPQEVDTPPDTRARVRSEAQERLDMLHQLSAGRDRSHRSCPMGDADARCAAT